VAFFQLPSLSLVLLYFSLFPRIFFFVSSISLYHLISFGSVSKVFTMLSLFVECMYIVVFQHPFPVLSHLHSVLSFVLLVLPSAVLYLAAYLLSTGRSLSNVIKLICISITVLNLRHYSSMYLGSDFLPSGDHSSSISRHDVLGQFARNADAQVVPTKP